MDNLNKIIHKGNKFTYYIGQVIGDRTIISDKYIVREGKKKLNTAYVKTKCKCGVEQSLQIGALSLLTGKRSCRSCSIERRGCTYKDISSDFFCKIKSQAKTREIEFNITPQDIYNQYIIQDKKCRFSGINLVFRERRLRKGIETRKRKEGSASVDRIDSNKGYIRDNIQIVHKHINAMKNSHTDEYFINLCKIITQRQKYEKMMQK